MTLTPSTTNFKDNHSHLPSAHTYTKRLPAALTPLSSDPLLKICEEDVCSLFKKKKKKKSFKEFNDMPIFGPHEHA